MLTGYRDAVRRASTSPPVVIASAITAPNATSQPVVLDDLNQIDRLADRLLNDSPA